MVCKECHAVCGSNARLTLCPTCERRLRSELAANMSPILRKAVEAAAAEVSVPYVSRIIQWFQLRTMEVREEAERLRGQLEKANQELTAAWGKCEVRRRNSLRYIAEIRRLRATKEDLGTCTWTGSEDCWESSCGVAWTFPEGGPTNNGMRFCHSCGRALVEVPDGTDEG